MRKPTKTTPAEEIAKARAERDAACRETSAACTNLVSMASRVVERLRKRRVIRPLRLVKKAASP